jgi:UDP-N-acetylglucosamine/UDP-N-acetylgalactosamine diphosphorylase
MDLENLRQQLTKHNQAHLLKFWDVLPNDKKEDLYTDLTSIDFAEVDRNFKRTCLSSHSNGDSIDELLEPVPKECFGSCTRSDEDTLKEYEEEGLKAVARGEVGVLLLAGGQGTRLGVTYPKGMYDVGLPSKKTLYQLQAERVLKLQAWPDFMGGSDGLDRPIRYR